MEQEITIRRQEACDGLQRHRRGEGQGSGDVPAVRRARARCGFSRDSSRSRGLARSAPARAR